MSLICLDSTPMDCGALDSELTCSLCSKLVRNPVTPACTHSMCRLCAVVLAVRVRDCTAACPTCARTLVFQNGYRTNERLCEAAKNAPHRRPETSINAQWLDAVLGYLALSHNEHSWQYVFGPGRPMLVGCCEFGAVSFTLRCGQARQGCARHTEDCLVIDAAYTAPDFFKTTSIPLATMAYVIGMLSASVTGATHRCRVARGHADSMTVDIYFKCTDTDEVCSTLADIVRIVYTSAGV